MIFRGLDLAYKAFRRARFNDSVFTPVFNFNGGQSSKKQQTLQDTIVSTIKMPNTLSGLASYQAPKVYNPTTNITNPDNSAYMQNYNNMIASDAYKNATEAQQIAMENALIDNSFKLGADGFMTPSGTSSAVDAVNTANISNTTTPWAQQEGFLGLTNGTWQGIGAGLNLANFGLNGILGYLNYRTAKKAMEQQNAYNHATYAANAKAYNTKLRSGNYIGRALAGDNYTDEMRKADDAGLKAAQVSETY